MRYLVALIIGIGALFGVNAFVGLFSLPRPWNSLAMGATVGITMVIVLLIWEVVKPSHKDAAPAKPAMSEDERAKARAERRSRLAAEAGVSLDDTESGKSAPEPTTEDSAAVSTTEDSAAVSTTEDRDSEPKPVGQDETSPEADESSIEAEPDTRAAAEPETLAPDEHDEEATGSSLESPPTGEPGISVDALEDAEPADTDGVADDDPVGDEPTAEGPDSTR